VLQDALLAEDAVQEAVLQAWLSLDKLRQPERFGAWLAGIALRVCRAWLRYRANQAWSLEALVGGRVLPEPADAAAMPLELVELVEIRTRVRQAVAELPVGQQIAVALFYLADLSYAETAALLGIETGAVKTRLHKARGRLRHSLRELWSEEHMTSETLTDFIDVQVEDVRAVPIDEPPGERRVVLLAEQDSDRVLPIWIGGFEGDAIAIGLAHAEASRPLTFSLAARLVEAAGGRLQEVRIDRLVEETFYAQVIVDAPDGTRTLDARPSDAIALALEASTPIRVSGQVMHQAAIGRAELPQKTSPDSRSARERIEQIRERLAQPRRNWSQSTLF
jgi:RNA polymerase sigma factor (sigma-70 family)